MHILYYCFHSGIVDFGKAAWTHFKSQPLMDQLWTAFSCENKVLLPFSNAFFKGYSEWNYSVYVDYSGPK